MTPPVPALPDPTSRRHLRTYVVLEVGATCDGAGVTPRGTVAAPSRRAALGVAAAHWRGTTVRVWRASTCRTTWLIAALGRDGTTARPRIGRRPRD